MQNAITRTVLPYCKRATMRILLLQCSLSAVAVVSWRQRLKVCWTAEGRSVKVELAIEDYRHTCTARDGKIKRLACIFRRLHACFFALLKGSRSANSFLSSRCLIDLAGCLFSLSSINYITRARLGSSHHHIGCQR